MAINPGGDAAPDNAGADVGAPLDEVATAATTPAPAAPPRRGAARQPKTEALPAPAVAGEQVAASVPEEPAGGIAGIATTMREVKSQMENKMMKTAADLVAFNQGNVEALLRSGQIWVAGVQDLGKQVVATAQAQFDETVSTFKAMAAAKSLKEAFDLQSTLARNSLDKAVAETGKITDASLKLAEQALAPITARMTLAVERFGKTV